MVGLKIKQRRVLLDLTQRQLAELIGVTYQQVHKYEIGVNRVSAGRLCQIAEALKIEAGYFFPAHDEGQSCQPTEHQRMTLELSRNFLAIADRRQRQAVCDLARSFAGSTS